MMPLRKENLHLVTDQRPKTFITLYRCINFLNKPVLLNAVPLIYFQVSSLLRCPPIHASILSQHAFCNNLIKSVCISMESISAISPCSFLNISSHFLQDKLYLSDWYRCKEDDPSETVLLSLYTRDGNIQQPKIVNKTRLVTTSCRLYTNEECLIINQSKWLYICIHERNHR